MITKIAVGRHHILPIFLAPLSGISDYPCRAIARALGVPMVVSEMIASEAVIAAHKDAQKLPDWQVEAGDATSPLVVQLAGTEPEVIARATAMVCELGADIVDLNFGCPARRVVKKASGSALMRDPVLCEEIFVASVEAARAHDKPVTVKMRLGWDDNLRTGVDIATRAERAGVQMLTVHGRTRCQFYEGQADPAAIRPIVEATSLPLIANGDIDSVAAAARALELSGANGVMVGRAAVGNPWLLLDIARALASDEPMVDRARARRGFDAVVETAISHLELLIADPRFTPETAVKAVRHFRKHLEGYASVLELEHSEIAQLMCINTPQEVITFLQTVATCRKSGQDGLKAA